MFKVVDLMLMFMILTATIIVLGVNMPAMASNTSVTQYVYLTINIYGNGNLTVETVLNYTTINKTTTFKIPAGYEVILTSNQPFWLGNGTLITTIFWGWPRQNTTLNVYFNISGVTYPPSEYTRVTVVNEGKLNLTVSIGGLIFNSTYFLTEFHIDNSSATFYAPIKSIVFIGYHENFYVNGSPAQKLTSIIYVYQYNIKGSTPVILVVTPAKNASTTISTTTTTSTLPSTTTITLPVPNTTVTITPHTGTVIPTSTASHGIPVGYYAIIVVIVIVLVAFFMLRRVRK